MTDILKSQIAYTPEVVGNPAHTSAIVCGAMGGSALPPLALSKFLTDTLVVIHRDYDLPIVTIEGALHIAISYSGNTEETLSFFEAAYAEGHPLAVITSGGELLARAEERGVPYVRVPDGMQPRDAFLVLTKALLALIGADDALEEFNAYPDLEGDVSEEAARLAVALQDTIPVVYASTHNEALAYISKILLNETAKIPAYSNVFPEMNHNELQAFPGPDASHTFVLMRDSNDHERIQRRMDVFEGLMRERGIPLHTVQVPADSPVHALLWVWLMLREAAHLLAHQKQVTADETPLITDFKGML